jgi:opacity protein-like surface antigen
MRLYVASVAITAILMMARPVLAQAPLPPEPEGIAVTPFIGVGFGGDLASAPVAFGVALGYGLNTRWTVEGELSFMPDATQEELIEFDTSLWSLSANVLYHFTAQRVTPYVTAGLGVMSANADLEGTGLVADDTSTKFAWNWGAGVKTALNERFGLRGDLRYFIGDELVPTTWRIYGGVVIRRLGR